MDEINKMIQNIENDTSYNKVKLLYELTQKIDIMKENLNKMLEDINNINNNININNINDNNNKSIDELEKLLNETDDLDKKINIFYHINSKIILLKKELFE